MSKILAVGNVTLDIINIVEHYPKEDEEIRAKSQHIRRGGNAGNTLAVLSQLGHQCTWAGTLADEPDAQLILDDLHSHKINTSRVLTVPQGKVPTSYVSLNQRSGSRTIVHYRDLPEYDFKHFQTIQLSDFDWVHFEGRNIGQTRQMMSHVKQHYPELPCSLEVEKPRTDIELLFDFADLLLFSRVYVNHLGFDEAEPFLRKQHSCAPHANLTCGWGKNGAYAMSRNGSFLYSPAFVPKHTIDTLGAGDVFVAGIIHHLSHDNSLNAALNEASTLAGKKCGQYGLDNLG